MLDSTQGNYGSAVSQLESLTRENPQWLDPHVELAALYYKLGRKTDGERERSTINRIMQEQQSHLAGQSSRETK